MTTEQLLISAIVGLIGIIIGGAGGAALFRKVLGMPTSQNTTDQSAEIIKATAEAFASVFKDEFSSHMEKMERAMSDTNASMNAIQISMANLSGSCIQRHIGLDREIRDLKDAQKD